MKMAKFGKVYIDKESFKKKLEVESDIVFVGVVNNLDSIEITFVLVDELENGAQVRRTRMDVW